MFKSIESQLPNRFCFSLCCLWVAGIGELCECEYNWIIDKVKSLTAYFGRTIDYYGMFNSQVPYGSYKRMGYGQG